MWLFPRIEEELGELTEKQQELIATLEMLQLEDFFPAPVRTVGRPAASRLFIARAFVAKAVYKIPQTDMLVERLESDKALRRICGWQCALAVPSEATFSRTFAEFAGSELPQRVHGALIERSHQRDNGESVIIGHVSHDSTDIHSREKAVKKEQEQPERKRKPGRPRKGEQVSKEPTRLERQATMTLKEMLVELPKDCDWGTKKDSKGKTMHWRGFKLHLAWSDEQVPVAALLTSASLHDSQAALALIKQSSERISYLYDLADSAYDANSIKDYSRSLGHVPIIDCNPRADKALKEALAHQRRTEKLLDLPSAESVRYRVRSTAERGNSRLKDDFGARFVRVKGHPKVLCHLMFGLLALTADQLMRLNI